MITSISIPDQHNEVSYREIIKQLAAQTSTKPYGEIPLINKKKRQKSRRIMSHVEIWVDIDTSLPDELEEEPDFLLNFDQVLPLHDPPPSLSIQQQSKPTPRFIQNKSEPTTSTVISPSPPHVSNTDAHVWKATLEKLKQSISSLRRRTEASTLPRFTPITHEYIRDTRYNSDHLRMISAELNMIRVRKLLSPLKPRGFLPRRNDPFVRGKPSPLHETPT